MRTLMHRILALLHADDVSMHRQGKAELIAALKAAGSVRAASESLGIARMTLLGWIKRLKLDAPNGRSRADVTDADVKATVKRLRSTRKAAAELGVSNTTVRRRLTVMGEPIPGAK